MPDQSGAGGWGYAESYYAQGAGEYGQQIVGDFALLAQELPDVVEQWLRLREAIFSTTAAGSLPSRMKELLVVAIEVAKCKTNPPPTFHAKKAIEAGASVREVAEAIALCIMLGGMVTYRESGRFALKAAVDRAAELAGKNE